MLADSIYPSINNNSRVSIGGFFKVASTKIHIRINAAGKAR